MFLPLCVRDQLYSIVVCDAVAIIASMTVMLPLAVKHWIFVHKDTEIPEYNTVIEPQRLGFGYQEPKIGIKGWVCQLEQALYDRRDSATLWNKELDTRLNRVDFYTLEDDVYVKGEDESVWSLLIHVDDFVAAAPIDEEVNQFFQLVKG
ncbi:Reverse transcriptase, RNA-dependent DNA polymerase [Penicillium griseofulvum]|uniref:Reverse transcriptase, RNA-dependent DNA polymerase n=1 Tax=Penicillium patulum TaxID=5078 RepID=A0A135LZ59_PENPA|nr:Reverse transcriptase, RNA-dependent DNA polymerase [Penicillium griseofulvum]KXG54252.1 Reverse transcriptase, RNA-dependent DNA polymerase [Penicillium griseofulvum]